MLFFLHIYVDLLAKTFYLPARQRLCRLNAQTCSIDLQHVKDNDNSLGVGFFLFFFLVVDFLASLLILAITHLEYRRKDGHCVKSCVIRYTCEHPLKLAALF